MADDGKNPSAAEPQPALPYAAAKTELERALHLGIEVEGDDPDLGAIVSTLTDAQIEWVAAGELLVGEGFTRPRNPSV